MLAPPYPKLAAMEVACHGKVHRAQSWAALRPTLPDANDIYPGPLRAGYRSQDPDFQVKKDPHGVSFGGLIHTASGNFPGRGTRPLKR